MYIIHKTSSTIHPEDQNALRRHLFFARSSTLSPVNRVHSSKTGPVWRGGIAMADDADASRATGAGGTNTQPASANTTLGDVEIDLLEPLERTAGAGDAQATAALLAAGTTVPIGENAAEGRPLRRTILHWAALSGNPAVVRDVLRAVAESGIAARAEALEAFSLGKPGGPDRTTPLHLAAEGGHTDVAITLLGFGARIDPVDGDDRIPLTICLDKGHDEMALELVRRSRRDVNIPVSSPDIPALHYAAWRGCLPVVELLLSKRASIDVPNVFFETPLHSAATCGPNAGEVIKRLLAAGIHIDQPNISRVRRSFTPSSTPANTLPRPSEHFWQQGPTHTIHVLDFLRSSKLLSITRSMRCLYCWSSA